MTTTRYLIIDKVNEVYLKVEAEADIRRELGEYFTFEVDFQNEKEEWFQ